MKNQYFNSSDELRVSSEEIENYLSSYEVEDEDNYVIKSEEPEDSYNFYPDFGF